jgi:hypothetical protein
MTILFAAFLLGLVFNATPGAVFAETVRRGAQQAYLKAIGTPYVRSASEDIDMLRKQLLAYCELDTLAMVKIWQKLTQITDTR